METGENQPVSLCLMSLVSDPDCVSLSIVGVSAAAHGTVRLECNGVVVYTPANNYWGADQFTYTVSDGTATSTGTISILVDSTPVINPVAVSTPEGTPITLNLLSYASDPNGNALTLGCVSGACHGSVVLNRNGTVTYTPSGYYYGSDSFNFTITDGFLTVSGTAQITVTKVNHAPVVCDVTACTGEGQGICLNWRSWADDIDGNSLSLAGISACQNGSLEYHSDGSLWYIPKAGFCGTETLSLGITDGFNTTNARITINVQSPWQGWGQSITENDNGSTLSIVSTLPPVVNLPCAEDALAALFGTSQAQAAGGNVKITLGAPAAPTGNGSAANTWAATFVCGNQEDQIVVLPDWSIRLEKE